MPDGNTYYWHVDLVTLTQDMDKFKVINTFEQTMQIWQRAIDGLDPVGQHLHLKSTTDISKAHFIFSFGPTEHHVVNTSIRKCPFDFDGNAGVLAHAWSLNTAKPYGGQMHLDESENWSEVHSWEKGQLNAHLLTVILHEQGHIWDLDHSEVKEAVMFAAYTGPKTTLHADDIAGLQAKLGPIKAQLAPTVVPEPKKKKWFACLRR